MPITYDEGGRPLRQVAQLLLCLIECLKHTFRTGKQKKANLVLHLVDVVGAGELRVELLEVGGGRLEARVDRLAEQLKPVLVFVLN